MSVVAVLGVVVLVAIGLTLQVKGGWKAERLVQQWATDNRLQIQRITPKAFGGRFLVARSRRQRVYRVVVKEVSGATRTADIRCGGFFVGMLSDELEVRWKN